MEPKPEAISENNKLRNPQDSGENLLQLKKGTA